MKKMRFIYLLGIIAVALLGVSSCLDTNKAAGGAASVRITAGNAPDQPDNSPEFKGTVRKITENKGTLSEFSYYVLVTDDQNQFILFNQKKRSLGFDDYIDKTVSVMGRMGTGAIGWRKQEKQGLLVESIRLD
jgi:hypothetical protein